MDRKIVYAGQIPLSAQMLQQERNEMAALAKFSEAVLGTSTIADGLVCLPTSPASLVVTVGPGSLYQLENLDASPFGSLFLDNTHNIVKQGVNLDGTLCPPATSQQAPRSTILTEPLRR